MSGYSSPSSCFYCMTGLIISKVGSCLGHRAEGNDISAPALELVLPFADVWKSPSLLGVLPFRECVVDPAQVTAELLSFDSCSGHHSMHWAELRFIFPQSTLTSLLSFLAKSNSSMVSWDYIQISLCCVKQISTLSILKALFFFCLFAIFHYP